MRPPIPPHTYPAAIPASSPAAPDLTTSSIVTDSPRSMGSQYDSTREMSTIELLQNLWSGTLVEPGTPTNGEHRDRRNRDHRRLTGRPRHGDDSNPIADTATSPTTGATAAPRSPSPHRPAGVGRGCLGSRPGGGLRCRPTLRLRRRGGGPADHLHAHRRGRDRPDRHRGTGPGGCGGQGRRSVGGAAGNRGQRRVRCDLRQPGPDPHRRSCGGRQRCGGGETRRWPTPGRHGCRSPRAHRHRSDPYRCQRASSGGDARIQRPAPDR